MQKKELNDMAYFFCQPSEEKVFRKIHAIDSLFRDLNNFYVSRDKAVLTHTPTVCFNFSNK